MKQKLIYSVLLSSFLTTQPIFANPNCEALFGDQSQATSREPQKDETIAPRPAFISSDASQKLPFKSIINLSDYKGKSFLSVMKEVIKPLLDKYASDGFAIADTNTVIAALDEVSAKVKAQALKAAGGVDNLKQVVSALQGQTISFYDLPTKIAAVNHSVDRYGLSTFLALASGGGIKVQLSPQDASYNVDYGTGKKPKDEMSGRSFGQSADQNADDASDKSYLQGLQGIFNEGKMGDFYEALMNILTNCDPSGLAKLTAKQKTVLDNFMTIYLAEQDRHLMADLRSHDWDTALFLATSVASFHAGQTQFTMMYDGKLVNQVPKQAPGGTPMSQRPIQPADMTYFWRFSSSSDPASRNRSGINVSRRDLVAETQLISDYMRKAHPDLVANVERHLGGTLPANGNIYVEVAGYLINNATPSMISDTSQLAQDYAAFLLMVREEADRVTQQGLHSQGTI